MGASSSKSETISEPANSTESVTSQDGETDNTQKPKCKPCCACPETRKLRDACIMERGEENCIDLIEAHKECLRKMGFNL